MMNKETKTNLQLVVLAAILFSYCLGSYHGKGRGYDNGYDAGYQQGRQDMEFIQQR